MSGTGPPQSVSGDIAQNILPIGCRPFVITQDMNYCKTMKWSKDEAVNSLDFQLYDCYGELIFQQAAGDTFRLLGAENDSYYTEFQMTLLCIEKQDNF